MHTFPNLNERLCLLIFMVFPTNERKTQNKMKMKWRNTWKLNNNKKQMTTKMDDRQIQYRKQVYHKSHTKRRKNVSNQWLIIKVVVIYRTKFVRLCYFFVSFFLKISQTKSYATSLSPSLDFSSRCQKWVRVCNLVENLVF